MRRFGSDEPLVDTDDNATSDVGIEQRRFGDHLRVLVRSIAQVMDVDTEKASAEPQLRLTDGGMTVALDVRWIFANKDDAFDASPKIEKALRGLTGRLWCVGQDGNAVRAFVEW